MTPESFTIRVYGILVHQQRILLSRENFRGNLLTKFPGGGLEFGEGVLDCLKREFMEEVGIEIHSHQLFHINEGYLKSKFHTNKQVLTIYYKVRSQMVDQILTADPANSNLVEQHDDQVVYWVSQSQIMEQPFTLPVDQEVVNLLTQSVLD